MNKTPHSFYTIRFTDCDPFGHLNNARYIDYFLNAREDHLKNEYQLDLSHFYQQGVSWLVAGHEISYLRPANYNERVSVKSALIQLTPGSVLVEMIMMDEKHTHLKSLMWTSFTHVNVKTGKRENHSGSFMEFAKTIALTGVDVSKGFQYRLKEIIEGVKQKA
ncbi:MAG TPA: acyl-CoA thioesterase [Ferruginibacter sp.]|nr:acyl-CoA thioesterase [Ferruginibacter sp.]